MAFADPQSVTVDAVPHSMPRTGFTGAGGVFTSADGEWRLEVSHNYGRRTRHLVRLTNTKVVSDPLVPDRNIPVSMSTYIVVDVPLNGYTADEIFDVVVGFTGWLTASSNAHITSLVGNES